MARASARVGARGERARARAGLVVIAGLLLGCRPDAPSQPPQPEGTATSTAAASTSSAASPGAAGTGAAAPDGTSPSPGSGLPDTCEIELELVEPTGAHGKGTSTKSGTEAKEAAWAQACAALKASHGVDCNDATRVGVIAERTHSLQIRQGSGQHQQRYEHEVELGVARRGKGFGDAPGDRQEACRRAREHACQALVQGPCPAAGVRVIAVDGKPPNPAAVEPRPATQAPRPTI